MAQSFIDLFSPYFLLGSVGFLIGGALMVNNVFRNGVRFPLAVVTVTACIYGGLFGTRILFVLLNNPTLFIHDFPLAIAFWQGGLSWLGGPILGCAVFLLVMRLARQPGWANVGSAVPGLALAHAMARWACYDRGCCYGAATDVPWAIYSNKLHTMVHPTQFYSMFNELVVAAILQVLWWKRREFRKYLMPLYGVLLGSHRFVTEAFRGEAPGPEIIDGLRFYQSLCVFILVLSLIVIMMLWDRRRGAIGGGALAAVTVAAVAFLQPQTVAEESPDASAFLFSEGVPRPVVASTEPAATADAPLYLVATRTVFEPHLDEWAALRRSEGFDVVVRAWDDAPRERDVSTWLDAQDADRVKYVLIVGDCGDRDETETPWHMPSCANFVLSGEAGLNYVYDAPFGDVDNNGSPDVAVGRLPVRTVSDLDIQIGKIVDAANRPLDRDWYRSVVWTGASGIDYQMDYVTTELSRELPGWLDVVRIDTVNDPSSQRDRFMKEIQRPAMISFVASHGAFEKIWTAGLEDPDYQLTVRDVADLSGDDPLGAMFFMACDTGKFDRNGEQGPSLAEAFVLHPGGPVNVVASSSTTHAMTNYFVTRAMMRELSRKPETIGDFFLAAQRDVYRQGIQTFERLARDDTLAQTLLEPFLDRARVYTPGVLQYECLTYNLFGDPACKLRIRDKAIVRSNPAANPETTD